MTIRKSSSILLISLIVASAHADDNGRGTKAIGLGNSGVVLRQSVWSVFYNPASVGTVRNVETGIFFVPSQFGMNELRTMAGAVVFPLRSLSIGVGVESFGFSLYRESGLILSVARSVDDFLLVGLSLRGKNISIDRYGSTRMGAVDVGLHAMVWEGLDIGFSTRNLLATRIGSVRERPAQSLLFGLSFSPRRGSTIYAEYESDIRYGGMIKGAFEQHILDVLALRVGIASNPDKFSAGFAVRIAPAEFSYAGYSHPDLGWTHQLELAITFQEGDE